MIDLKLPPPMRDRAMKPLDGTLGDDRAANSFAALLDGVGKTSTALAEADGGVTTIDKRLPTMQAALPPEPAGAIERGEVVVEQITLSAVPFSARSTMPVRAWSLDVTPVSRVETMDVSSPSIGQRKGFLGQPNPLLGQDGGVLAKFSTVQNMPVADKSAPPKNNFTPAPRITPLPDSIAAAALPRVDFTSKPLLAMPIAADPATAVAATPPDTASAVPRTVRITLRPQELGEVQVMVRHESGQIRVTITAETEAGHAALVAKSETLATLVRDIKTVVPGELATVPNPNGQTEDDRNATTQQQPEEHRRNTPQSPTEAARRMVENDAETTEVKARGLYI